MPKKSPTLQFSLRSAVAVALQGSSASVSAVP
jgi:hypothetical protein